MKICIFFLALFHSVFILAQDPKPANYNIRDATLCIGDLMQLGDKSIKFKKVVSDSRCPKAEGITCVWAGEVRVLVGLYEDGKFKGDKIITGSNILAEEIYVDGEMKEDKIVTSSNISIAEFFNMENLVIKSIIVSPYPRSGKISPAEYSLSLKISERVNAD